MYNAFLDISLRIHRFNGLADARQVVNGEDKDLLNATVS